MLEDYFINGIKWNISSVDAEYPSLKFDGKYHLGATYNQSCMIYLDDSMPRDQFKRVLMHELTHAFTTSMGFSDSDMGYEQVADFLAAHAEKIVEMADGYMGGCKLNGN